MFAHFSWQDMEQEICEHTHTLEELNVSIAEQVNEPQGGHAVRSQMTIELDSACCAMKPL